MYGNFFFFFFQAEDGIRDFHVTGVQTCALPICLAAAPQQPGWSLTSIYYHTSVSAGADVARAREFETGRIPLNLTANVNASLDARADLALALPTYTFATPVFGGQLTLGAIGLHGRESTSLAGTVSAALATPL